MEDAGIIDDAMTFLEKLRGMIVQIKFIKKDKSVRIMKCTLDFTHIPKTHQPKSVNIPKIMKLIRTNNIIHVYDVEKRGWRSVPFTEVEWLVTNDNKRYRMRIKNAQGI